MLRKIIIISLSLLLLYSCQGKSEKNVNIIETKKTEKIEPKNQSESEWIINSKGVGIIELGNSISKTANQLSKIYKVKKSMFNTYLIYENKEEIMLISPIENTDIIENIRIYTDKWKTKSGLKKGMTIKEINKFYDEFFMEYNVSSGFEYFPKYGEFEKKEKTYNSLTKFYFKGIPMEYIGNYNFENVKATIHRSKKNNEKATLSFIEISLMK